MKMLIAALITAISISATNADTVGFQAFNIDAQHHAKPMEATVWYPSSGDGKTMLYADNPVFQGMKVQKRASLIEGKHPVVLMSHGMGGGNRSVAWLSNGLAQRGAIVISVSHPNSTWVDFNMSLGIQHWTRALDLSLALDVVTDLPEFKAHMDNSRVMAAGFSYGGLTALTLGGLRLDHEAIVKHCEDHREKSELCARLLSSDIDLGGQDEAKWNASYKDVRVTHVGAIEPGLVWGIEPEDVSDLIGNVRMIGLGDGADRMLDTNFDASGLAPLLPNAKVDRFAPAFHFTAMPLCKPKGAFILETEKDDPVCTDPKGTDRAAVHSTVIDRLAVDIGL